MSPGPLRRTAAAGRLAILALATAAALLGAGGCSGETEPDAGDPSAPSETGEILWSADMETRDTTQWLQPADSPRSSQPYPAGGFFTSGTGRARVVTSPVRSGRHALALSIRGADGTRGDQAVRAFRWGTRDGRPLPQAAYFSVWLFFPRTFEPQLFWNIMQWKTKVSASRVDPLHTLNVTGGPEGMRFYLYRHAGEDDRLDADGTGGAGLAAVSDAPIPVDRWVYVQALYRWSTERTGSVVVWQDGNRILDVRDVVTQYPSRDRNARQWSVNNYTDDIRPRSATIYVDDVTISAAREASAGSPA